MLLYSNSKGSKITYQQALDYLNSNETVVTNFKENNTELFLLNFIKAICNDVDLILLDFDFTDDEVLQITQQHYQPNHIKKNFIKFDNVEALINAIKNSKSTVGIFTSGTTGQPKIVTHTIGNLIREARISEKFNNNIWGLAYNPTHIAGVQVIFQAILNGNSIIDVFGLSRNEIYQLINKHQITHISATPTFYRLLLPIENSFPFVKNVSVGGEKSSEEFLNKIGELFPVARINNIYASTEAGTLLASHGFAFKIPDSKKEYLKIEANELFIHKYLMGKSNVQNEWYATGDMIEWVDENAGLFKIVSRKNELLNIGGYKVNPTEVEQIIETIEGVNIAYVYGKSNSVLGTILCCDISMSKELSELEIKQYLKDKLQTFKIPRKFYFKTTLELNRSGKVKRTKNE